MTENAFYPIFLCVALVLVRMLERPTRAQPTRVLALCVLAYETRQQALALFPAVLTAPLLLGLRAARTLPHRSTALRRAVAVAGGGRRGGARAGRRSRSSARTRPRQPRLLGRRRREVAALARRRARSLPRRRPRRGFVVLAFSWRSLERAAARVHRRRRRARPRGSSLEVAAFASLPGVARVEERNMFYVAPFFLIALLLWVTCVWLWTLLPRVAVAVVLLRNVAVSWCDLLETMS